MKVKVRLLFKLEELLSARAMPLLLLLMCLLRFYKYHEIRGYWFTVRRYDKWPPYIGVGGRDYSRFCIHFRPPAATNILTVISLVYQQMDRVLDRRDAHCIGSGMDKKEDCLEISVDPRVGYTLTARTNTYFYLQSC
ncbi:hypothetical protein CBL_07112 [Carabus blaptoides fortunei]